MFRRRFLLVSACLPVCLRRSDAFDALQLEFTVYLLTTWFDHKLKTLMDFPKALVQTRSMPNVPPGCG